jgi:hypothetical protein
MKLKLYAFFFLSFFLGSSALMAQKSIDQKAKDQKDLILRLEKVNSPKTKRFVVGDEVRLLLVTGEWYTGAIERLDIKEGIIAMPQGLIPIDKVIGFQTQSQYRWGRLIRNQSITLGAGILLFSLADPLTGMPYNTLALYVAPGVIIAGFLTDWIIRSSYKRIGDKWRLRILDLSFD